MRKFKVKTGRFRLKAGSFRRNTKSFRLKAGRFRLKAGSSRRKTKSFRLFKEALYMSAADYLNFTLKPPLTASPVFLNCHGISYLLLVRL